MTDILEILRSDSVYRLGWALLHSLWQIALLASVLALLLTAFRRRSANLRYLTACAGLAAMFALPLVTYWIVPGRPASEVAAVSTPPGNPRAAPVDTVLPDAEPPGAALPSAPPPEFVPAHPGTEWDSLPLAGQPSPEPTPSAEPATPLSERVSQAVSPWVPWLVLAWFVGVFVLSVWHLGGWIALQRLKYLGTTAGSQPLARRLAELIERMQLSRPVRMFQSALVDVPAVIGWLRPVLLLPAAMLGEMSPPQIDAVLAHELAHIRRYDYLVNLLQTVFETLLFYHPAVWWLSRRIRIERENCCDDAAVAVCGSSLDYAAALMAMEQGRVAPRLAVAAGGADRGGTALSRVRRVLNVSGHDPVRPQTSLVGVFTVVTLLGLLAGYIATAGEPPPQKADQAAEEAPEEEEAGEATEEPAQPADLKIEARVAGIDGTSPQRSSITFWKAVDPESLKKSDKRPGGPGFGDVPHVWRDRATDKIWQPIHNFGAGDRATKEGLEPGDYRVTAYVGHGSPTMLAVSRPVHLDGSRKQTVVTLRMEDGPSLKIEVVDARTGKPIEYAGIRLVRSDGLAVVPWSSTWSVHPRGNQYTFEHLAPGEYTLEVFKRAYRYGDQEYAAEQGPLKLHLAANQDRQMAVKLKAAGPSEEEARRRWPWAVTGTVTDAQGRPLEGVQLRASCGMGSLMPTGETLSDQQGNYTLRFGPGMRTRKDDGTWGAGIQAATIFAFKAGYTEKNLCRQGGLLMGDKLPEKGDHWYGQRERVVVPGKPRRLDFVMVPAASLEGEVVDEQGKPIADKQISVRGRQMLPSTSVLAQGKTDREGRFRFEGIPANYGWWFSVAGQGRTQPVTFPGPGAYRVKLQLAHYAQYNLDVFRITSVTDPEGNEVGDKLVGDDPSARPPVAEELQDEGRSYLRKMAAACRDWFGPPPGEVRNYEYRFRLGDAEPTTLRVGDASRAAGPIRQGITYLGTPHILASRPEKVVFRQVEVGQETILLRFLVQDAVKIAAGNGVSGPYRGYFSTPLREGLLVLDKTTYRPVRTDIGGVRETFSRYMGLGDGRFVPLEIRIQHGSTDWDWRFRVYRPGLWLLSESRTRDGEDRGERLVTVDEVKVNGKAAVPMAQDGAAAEVESLKAKIREIESLCTPAKGTLRHAVEKRFGKGVPSEGAEAPRKRGKPHSTYWLYEFCENGSLLICYDSESLAEVVSALYLDPHAAKGRPEPATPEEQLRELEPRLAQMQLILAEYKKRFGEDYKNAWGKAVEGVQVRVRADNTAWIPGEDPTFQVDIRNRGKRERFIAYPQSCKVEVDGTWHTANFDASGRPRSVGFGGRLTYSLSLGDFLSSQAGDRPVNLRKGKHTVRVALSNVGEREERPGYENGVIAFGSRKFEAISNHVEIEIVPDEPKADGQAAWGPVSNGLRCRLLPATQRAEVPEGQNPGKIDAYVTYELENVSDRALKFLPWSTPLEDVYGTFRVSVRHAHSVTGLLPIAIREAPGPGDFVTIAPGRRLSRRVRLWYDLSEPGTYKVSTLEIPTDPQRPLADYQRPAGHDLAVYYAGDAEKAKQNPDNVWTGSLTSNTVAVSVVRPAQPEDVAEPHSDQGSSSAFSSGPVAWGQPVRGLQMGLGFRGQERPYRIGELVGFALYVRNVCDRPMELVDRVAVNPPRDDTQLPAPSFLDGQGRPLSLDAIPSMGFAARQRRRSLAAGETVLVGTSYLRLGPRRDSDDPDPYFSVEPGTYPVQQRYHFTNKLRITSNLRSGRLALDVVPVGSPTQGKAVAWGPRVEGLQARLRPNQMVWKAGTIPSFKAAVRNRGSRPFGVPQSQSAWCELQIDGHWYKWAGPKEAKSAALSPGQRCKDVRITAVDSWRRPQNREVLQLAAGKHTVRVALVALRADTEEMDPVRVVSNPVEIEVVADQPAAGGEKRGWGPAVEGAPPDPTAKLVQAFEKAKYHWQQLEVAQQTVKSGDRSVIAALSRHLDSDDEHLRCNAGFVLAGLGDERGLEAIISELKTKKLRPSERPRSDTGKPFLEQRYGYYAIHVLGKLRDKRAVPVLIEFLDKEEKHRDIEWALGEIGDQRATAALKRVLKHEDPHRHLWAGSALAKLGDPAGVPTVAKFLKDPQWTYRRHAAEGLGASGDARAVPHLIEALSDESPDVRVSACQALAELGDPKALPHLEKLLDDRTTTKTRGPTVVRDEVRKAIGSIQSKQPRWGPAVEGVQVRLRADKRVWKAGETPTFKADIRNGAKSTLYDTRGRRTIYNLEFDGHWYMDPSRVRKRPLAIPAGGQHAGGSVLPLSPKNWRRTEPPRTLELTPGKHTVRVAFVGTLGAVTEAGGGKPVRAVSNAVQIEIVQQGPAEAPTREGDRPGVGSGTPDADDPNAVATLRKLGRAGAELTLDKDGRVTKVYISPTWATGKELALLRGLPRLQWLVIERRVKANPPEQLIMIEADLAQVKELTNLKRLQLPMELTSDAALAHLKELGRLQHLTLSHSGITDAGLAHLRGLASLESLGLSDTTITDAGLMHLKRLTKLGSVDLGNTPVTPRGMKGLMEWLPNVRLFTGKEVFDPASVADDGPNRDDPDDPDALAALKNLGPRGASLTRDDQGWVTRVSISPTWATAEELALLRGLPRLEWLSIGRLVKANPPEEIKMTEHALVHLRGLKGLQRLWLGGVPVTDASLAHLKGLTELEHLNISHTQVTDKGLVHLQGLAKLTDLRLGNTHVTDEGLEHVERLDRLQFLDLTGTGVTDVGLAHLKRLAKLRWLDLTRTKVNGLWLIQLNGLTELRHLGLDSTQVTDANLARLTGVRSLESLSLNGSKITDAGLEHLKKLPGLQRLYLSSTGVTDGGVVHLAAMAKLRDLDLRRTKVTNQGVKKLQQALPDTRIRFDAAPSAEVYRKHVANLVLPQRDDPYVPSQKWLKERLAGAVPYLLETRVKYKDQFTRIPVVADLLFEAWEQGLLSDQQKRSLSEHSLMVGWDLREAYPPGYASEAMVNFRGLLVSKGLRPQQPGDPDAGPFGPNGILKAAWRVELDGQQIRRDETCGHDGFPLRFPADLKPGKHPLKAVLEVSERAGQWRHSWWRPGQLRIDPELKPESIVAPGSENFPQDKAVRFVEGPLKQYEWSSGEKKFSVTAPVIKIETQPGFDMDITARLPIEVELDGKIFGKPHYYGGFSCIDGHSPPGRQFTFQPSPEVPLQTGKFRWRMLLVPDLHWAWTEPAVDRLCNRRFVSPWYTVGIEALPDTIHWGRKTNGLQAGLGFDLQEGPHKMGELVSFRLYVRNVSDQTVELVDFSTRGWMPTVKDSSGKALLIAGVFDGRVQRRRQTLPAGRMLLVGTVELRLDANPQQRRRDPPHAYLKPGAYRVSQKYRFADNPEASWSGELTTGELELKVVPAEPPAEGQQTNWGPAVEGVQCRLEPDKPTWKDDEIPRLKTYVRHQTEAGLFLSNRPDFGAQLEVDGHWHRYISSAPWQGQAHGSSKFRTKDEQPLKITLDVNWKHVDNKQPLRLDPGRHVVRFAWEGFAEKGPREGPDQQREVVLLSNPVEITILPDSPQPKPADVHPDEKVAAAALQRLGGILAAGDQGRIRSVRLSRTAVIDADLGHLKGLSGLRSLYLDDTRISNAALRHIAGLAGLKTLSVNYTRVGDAGLEHLKGLGQLGSLEVLETEVTDAGLRDLKKALPGLQTTVDPLKLSGLADLRGWRNSAELSDDYELVSVDLLGPKVADAWLERLKDRHTLQDVCLDRRKITDAGLARLRGLTELHTLYLSSTQVTDRGLEYLKDMKKLKTLFLAETQIGDAGLAHLSGLTNLEMLWINGTQVTDAGMVHLKPLRKLAHLRLNDCQLSGAGLSHLRDLTRLTTLELNGTAVSDAGLVHLKPFVNLELLYLSHTSVTDAGLGHLTGLKKLRALMIEHAHVTDQGIKMLKLALPKASFRHTRVP